MKSDKFNCIKLLNSFSEKEVNYLKELVSCRFFNPDKHVVILLNVLKKHVWQQENFNAEIQRFVYEEVFSRLNRSQNQLNIKQKNLLFSKMSILTRLMEQFLSIKAMKKNDAYKSELLYPQLLERKQDKLYEMHIKKDKKKFGQQVQKTEDDYAQYYKTDKTIFEYLYLKERLPIEDNLPELVYNLDIYYLLSRLSLQLTSLTTQRAFGRTYNFPSQNIIVQLLDYPPYASHPVIIIYLTCIKLMESKADEDYHHLLSLLEEYTIVIHKEYLIDFYKTGVSHCVYKIRSGDLSYNKNMFDLYQTMHDKNLVLEKGDIISPMFFKNMIMIACRVKEYEWATIMNDYYEKYILEEIRKSVYHFNLGTIAFHQKGFETAHGHFALVEKFDTTFYINARVLILKCLYEKKGISYSERTMTAFRSAEDYFKKHPTLPTSRKMSYKNFIEILRLIYKIRHRDGKVTIERVETKLSKQKVFADKKWLLEKITELKQKKS